MKYVICYECGEECELMPERESLPPSTTDMVPITCGTTLSPNYAPTSKTYKCVNPKCWVTKIEVRWS